MIRFRTLKVIMNRLHFTVLVRNVLLFQSVCKALDAQLAEIGTARENTFLVNKVKALNGKLCQCH